MKENFQILIADRNPHVRDFLRREMLAEGYQVKVAQNGREVLRRAYHKDGPDLVILDPDLPDANETSVLKILENRVPVLPVVIHAFLLDYGEQSVSFRNAAAFVEKRGNSVERLIEVVSIILNKPDGKTISKKQVGKGQSGNSP